MNINYDTRYLRDDYDNQANIFKARYGYDLPEAYIRFLKTEGTGIFPNPGDFEGVCQVIRIFDFSLDKPVDFKSSDTVVGVYEEYVKNGWLSTNLMPIASANSGHTTFCLILSGPLAGQVTRRDDESLLVPDDYDAGIFEKLGTYIVATSIDDFISKLEPLDE